MLLQAGIVPLVVEIGASRLLAVCQQPGDMCMSERVIIVPGAGSGIGRATAVELASRGLTPVLVGRTQTTLEETANLALEANGSIPVAVEPIDVTDAGLCRDMIRRVLTRFGRI